MDAVIGIATGSRSPGRRPSTGSSRSAIGRRVVESGTPGRALTSVASRTRASGRRRATTMWSAPVAVASSSTIAPRIASGETDRDRLERMRAKDSASSRRPTSSAVTVWRCRMAAKPTTRTSPTMAQSAGRDRSVPIRRTAIRPRMKKEVAKIHQARLVRASGVSVARVGRLGVSLTSGIKDGGRDPRRPSPALVRMAAGDRYLRPIRPIVRPLRCPRLPRRRGRRRA